MYPPWPRDTLSWLSSCYPGSEACAKPWSLVTKGTHVQTPSFSSFLAVLLICLLPFFFVCFPFIRSYFLLTNNSQLFPTLSIRTNKMASTGLKEDTDDEQGALALEKPTVESGRQTWKQRISQPDEDHNYVSNIINMIKKTEQIIFLGGIRTAPQRSCTCDMSGRSFFWSVGESNLGTWTDGPWALTSSKTGYRMEGKW